MRSRAQKRHVVLVVGADGAGKTTLISRIAEERRDVTTAYFGENRFVTRSAKFLHARNGNVARTLFTRLAYPRDLKRRTWSLKGRKEPIVLIDRWPMFPFQPGASTALRRRYSDSLQTPTLLVLIDGDPEVLRSRKPEGRVENLERNILKSRHLAHAGIASSVYTLDASLPLEHNVKSLNRLLEGLDRMDVPDRRRRKPRLLQTPLYLLQSLEKSMSGALARSRAKRVLGNLTLVDPLVDCGGLDETKTFRAITRTHGPVAVKALGTGLLHRFTHKKHKGPVIHRPSAAVRLKEQASMMRRLEGLGLGPRILREGKAAYAMEWLDSRPFVTLSPDERTRSFPRVAEAMNRMHDAGLYHGDLHIENILIDADGSPMFIDPEPGLVPDLGSERKRTYDTCMLLGSFLPLQPGVHGRSDVITVLRQNGLPPIDVLEPFLASYAHTTRFLRLLGSYVRTEEARVPQTEGSLDAR